ncbi:MAG: TetR/AcrR family transcriptional regulator [Bdellovibrionaceae bacterium]|nr:TetR/AcrR family transcriptional regulator [Pseudobdellovibrionaceae bacterium]
MRVSQEEKAQIKEKILVETLASLKVWGQNAAPVDKIMKRLGLTSGALYSHFKSKDDLIAQVILRELDRLIAQHSEQYKKYGSQTVAKFVEYYLDERHIDAVERGCVFVALGSDLHRLKPSVREMIEEKMQIIFTVMSSGLPHKRADERLKYAKFIFSSMVGTLVMARSMKNDDVKIDMIRTAKKMLLTISREGVKYENKQ